MSTVEVIPRYRDVLRLPHAALTFSAALLGRLSFAMVSLALLLTVQRNTGSFAAAGVATGVFGLGNVVVSPARARWVDRRGHRATLPRLVTGYSSLLVALAVVALVAAVPAWLLIVLAGAAGLCPPPLGAVMRGMWAQLVVDPRGLARAYSLDSVAEELLFVTGPVLVGVAAALAHPAVALMAAAAVAFVGTFAMARGPVSVGVRPVRQTVEGASDRPLRQRGFRPLLLVLFGVGVILGAVEIVVPAFAQDHGQAGVAGLLLALLSVGSAAGGLVYGRRDWGSPLAVRLLLLTGGLILVTAVLAAAGGALMLAGLLLLAGVFLAPTLITGYLLADALTLASVRTESSSWVSTASNAGAALAAAGAGLLVDRAGTSTTFLTGAGLAAVCMLVASIRAGNMRSPSR